MKQIDECLDRVFNGQRPLNKKWKAFIIEGYLYVFHYTHRVFVLRLHDRHIIEQWWEKPADKRGLNAIKLYMNKKFETDFTLDK